MKAETVTSHRSMPAFPGGRLRSHSGTLSTLQRLCDAVIILGGFVLWAQPRGETWATPSGGVAVLAAVLFYVLAEAEGLYRSQRLGRIRSELRRVLQVWLIVVGASLLTLHLLADAPSSPTLQGWLLVTPAALGAWRALGRQVLRVMRRRGYNSRRLAIVGSGEFARYLDRTLSDNRWVGYRVVGLFDNSGGRRRRRRAAADVRPLDALVHLAGSGGVDVVYVALAPGLSERTVETLLAKLSDSTISVYLIGDRRFDPRRVGAQTKKLRQLPWLHPCRVDLGGLVAFSLYETPFLGPYGWLKRVEDLAISSAALMVLALPMLLIAVGVKLSGPGPVLFGQRRYGLGGKQILVWKFRSMTVCEDGAGVEQARRHDPRVTSFGRFIRRTSLDELPQLINVLIGNMSIVGPRPHAVAHNEYYRGMIAGYMLRHKVKPGITGWAQINGYRGETATVDKMSKRVELDLDYIRRWSLWLDIRIILKTLIHGFIDRNAY